MDRKYRKVCGSLEFSEKRKNNHSDDTNKVICSLVGVLLVIPEALSGLWEAPALEPCTPSFRKDEPHSSIGKWRGLLSL